MIRFNVIRNVKSPTRNIGEDAGFDFYVPEFDESFTAAFAAKNNPDNAKLNANNIVIEPGKDVMIPSGIKSSFAENIALIAMNKSGIASKDKLLVGACVVDSSYQGEIHIHLFNTTTERVIIPAGKKIIQFVPYVIDVSGVSIEHTDDDTFYNGVTTSRGAGGFGSTGV